MDIPISQLFILLSSQVNYQYGIDMILKCSHPILSWGYVSLQQYEKIFEDSKILVSK